MISVVFRSLFCSFLSLFAAYLPRSYTCTAQQYAAPAGFAIPNPSPANSTTKSNWCEPRKQRWLPAPCQVIVVFAFINSAACCKTFMLHLCLTVFDRLFFSPESALLCSPCKYAKNGVSFFNCLLIYYYLARASLPLSAMIFNRDGWIGSRVYTAV